MSNDREREMRLKAAELHGAMPAEAGIETLPYDSGAVRFDQGNVSVYVSAKRDFLIIRGSDCEDTQIESWEIESLFALLQEARRVMTRDGQGGAK